MNRYKKETDLNSHAAKKEMRNAVYRASQRNGRAQKAAAIDKVGNARRTGYVKHARGSLAYVLYSWRDVQSAWRRWEVPQLP